MLTNTSGMRIYRTAFRRPATFIATEVPSPSKAGCTLACGMPRRGRRRVSCRTAPALVRSRHALMMDQRPSMFVCGNNEESCLRALHPVREFMHAPRAARRCLAWGTCVRFSRSREKCPPTEPRAWIPGRANYIYSN